MICPHCRKEMRNVHEYNDEARGTLVVWYCWEDDFRLVLNSWVENVTVIEQNADGGYLIPESFAKTYPGGKEALIAWLTKDDPKLIVEFY